LPTACGARILFSEILFGKRSILTQRRKGAKRRSLALFFPLRLCVFA
jgi:hypothetical protein